MESDMDVFMRRIDTNPLDLLLLDDHGKCEGTSEDSSSDPCELIKEIKDEIIVFVKWVANGLTSLELMEKENEKLRTITEQVTKENTRLTDSQATLRLQLEAERKKVDQLLKQRNEHIGEAKRLKVSVDETSSAIAKSRYESETLRSRIMALESEIELLRKVDSLAAIDAADQYRRSQQQQQQQQHPRTKQTTRK